MNSFLENNDARLTYTQAISEAIREEMDRDEAVFQIGGTSARCGAARRCGNSS